MKTKFATAGVLLGALMLPLTGFTADTSKGTTKSASPSSVNETAAGSDTSAKQSTKRRSSQPVSDSVITTKVKGLLAKDKLASAMNVEVTTVNGVVSLAGTAKTKAEAAKAVSIAKKVKGVKSVKNDITVQG